MENTRIQLLRMSASRTMVTWEFNKPRDRWSDRRSSLDADKLLQIANTEFTDVH